MHNKQFRQHGLQRMAHYTAVECSKDDTAKALQHHYTTAVQCTANIYSKIAVKIGSMGWRLCCLNCLLCIGKLAFF